MSRTVPTLMLLAALGLLAALPIAASAKRSPAGPTADASRACSIRGQQRSLGTTYVLSLRARVTKCSDAKRIVRAYHACRHENGRAGRCHRKVFGYSCAERRLNQIPSQYDARVRCKKANREVFHIYTQNT